MLAAATVLYVFSLIKAIGYLKLKFYPSFAAFTFPFVISAIASKQSMACLAKLGSPMPALKYMVILETILAVAFVVYTFVKFMVFLFAAQKA